MYPSTFPRDPSPPPAKAPPLGQFEIFFWAIFQLNTGENRVGNRDPPKKSKNFFFQKCPILHSVIGVYWIRVIYWDTQGTSISHYFGLHHPPGKKFFLIYDWKKIDFFFLTLGVTWGPLRKICLGEKLELTLVYKLRGFREHSH